METIFQNFSDKNSSKFNSYLKLKIVVLNAYEKYIFISRTCILVC